MELIYLRKEEYYQIENTFYEGINFPHEEMLVNMIKTEISSNQFVFSDNNLIVDENNNEHKLILW